MQDYILKIVVLGEFELIFMVLFGSENDVLVCKDGLGVSSVREPDSDDNIRVPDQDSCDPGLLRLLKHLGVGPFPVCGLAPLEGLQSL